MIMVIVEAGVNKQSNVLLVRGAAVTAPVGMLNIVSDVLHCHVRRY